MSPRHTAKKKARSVSKTTPSLPVLHPHAAGIDIGAREIYVAVPPDRDPKPVRVFASFTEDLLALRDWLKSCGVLTVAMESTDVPDSQWLQYFHAVGLLRAAATCVHRLHKALTQMNIQLQHGIADITAVTGLATLEAILAGERDPIALAKLKDGRIRATADVIAKSLRGDWRSEHLFTLRQCLATWKHYQTQITDCDTAVARLLQSFTAKADPVAQPLPPRTSTHKTPQKNEPRF